MQATLLVLLSFLLTGLLGNWLVQRWQTRNWIAQQRFLGEEKEYVALKDLVDEICGLMGVRIFYMQRLNRSLNSVAGEELSTLIKEHGEAVKRWNERLTSFYVRLPILAADGLAIRLEESIQLPMVRISGELSQMTARRRKGENISNKEVARRDSELNQLQGRAIDFNRRLVNLVGARRTEVYFGKEVRFVPANFKHFSTRQLVVALFVREVKPLAIFGAARDT